MTEIIQRRPAVALLVALLALASCGDGDDSSSDDPAPVATAGAPSGTAPSDTAPSDTAPSDTAAAVSAAGEGGAEAAGGDEWFTCPLTGEQVSAILGASVEKAEGTCVYSPGAVSGIPSAGFFGQPPCERGNGAALGYQEELDGLGVPAYVRIDGAATAELLVCAAPAFMVFVDTGTLSDAEADAAVATAEQLARAAIEAG